MIRSRFRMRSSTHHLRLCGLGDSMLEVNLGIDMCFLELSSKSVIKGEDNNPSL